MEEWAKVALALVAAPAAWEFAKWLWGFGRKKEYFDAAEQAHIRDLERAQKEANELRQEIKGLTESRKELIKNEMRKDGAIMRLQIKIEQKDAEIARLQEEASDSRQS